MLSPLKRLQPLDSKTAHVYNMASVARMKNIFTAAGILLSLVAVSLYGIGCLGCCEPGVGVDGAPSINVPGCCGGPEAEIYNPPPISEQPPPSPPPPPPPQPTLGIDPNTIKSDTIIVPGSGPTGGGGGGGGHSR